MTKQYEILNKNQKTFKSFKKQVEGLNAYQKGRYTKLMNNPKILKPLIAKYGDDIAAIIKAYDKTQSGIFGSALQMSLFTSIFWYSDEVAEAMLEGAEALEKKTGIPILEMLGFSKRNANVSDTQIRNILKESVLSGNFHGESIVIRIYPCSSRPKIWTTNTRRTRNGRSIGGLWPKAKRGAKRSVSSNFWKHSDIPLNYLLDFVVLSRSCCLVYYFATVYKFCHRQTSGLRGAQG